MDKLELTEQIKSIDCSNSKYFTNWLIAQYKKEPFDIEKVKDYLLKYYVLFRTKPHNTVISFNSINGLFNMVDNGIMSDYDIIIENDDLIIYKPNSYIKRKQLSYIGHNFTITNNLASTLYCTIIKNNDIVNKIGNYFITIIINKAELHINKGKNINVKYIEKLGIKKYLIGDDITERIKNETLRNIRLLQQEEINGDLYLYNYDYSNIKIKCKKINGNVKLISDFKVIPNFLKDIVITGKFDSRHNLLENLINCPQIVHSIDCSYNKITSLIGTPNFLSGDLDCSHNSLVTLKNSPRIIGGKFDCDSNEIISLIGAPINVGYFSAFGNNIRSLIGIPYVVYGSIYLSCNKITSLFGLQDIINGDLKLGANKITTLKNSPKFIKYKIDYSENFLVDDYRPQYDSNGYLINEYNG